MRGLPTNRMNLKGFINNSINPWIKAVWNVRFDVLEANKTMVSTETRSLCVAPVTSYTLGLYWLIKNLR
jgi:hypothetical protein